MINVTRSKRARYPLQDWISPAKPEMIVNIPYKSDSKRPTFNINVFDNIIRGGKVEDLPVFIVCIKGVLRSGKSFLLNLMKIFLDYYKKVRTPKISGH